MKMKLLAAAAAITVVAPAAAQAQTSYSTGFEQSQGFTPGSLPPGANEGNANWQYAENGSTAGTVSMTIAHSGTQSLAIGNNGSGNDGVIQGVRSPELLAGAGETQSGAAFNQFNSSFWFHSGDWAPGSDYFASINAWSTDRMTYVALDYSGGQFSVYGVGMTADTGPGTFDDFLPDATIATGLQAGVWYRLDQQINFVDSVYGGDDQVSYSLFDAGGSQIGSTLTTSWDAGNLGSDRFYPGATLTPVNQLNFRTAFTTPGTGFYIDDVSYSASNAPAAVPEPASWAMMIGGFGLAGAAMRRRRATVAFA